EHALITALVNGKTPGAAESIIEVGVESEDAGVVASAVQGLTDLGADPVALAHAKGYFTDWTLYGPFDNGENEVAGKAPAELLGVDVKGQEVTAEGVPAVVDIRKRIAKSRNVAAIADT